MSIYCSPGFEPLLAQHFSLQVLEQQDTTIFGLWPDLTLAYMNPGWFRFARENQGEPSISQYWKLGRTITDALPPVLHPFYVDFYTQALEREPSPDQPLTHEYECSSPDLYRKFVLKAYNLGFGSGLLVINSKRAEQAHDRQSEQDDPGHYLDANGNHSQCSHCRRFRNFVYTRRWDWIPAWLNDSKSSISHTLCPICFDYYYGISK